MKSLVKDESYNKKFLQLLNKLPLQDLKGITLSIINYEDIPILEKQKFVKIVNIFKQLLQKKKEQGKTHHNNMNIDDIINFL